jgi:SAM-dependent methyltransferase
MGRLTCGSREACREPIESRLVNRAAYDEIGRGYSDIRRPDPRLAAQITAALGDARTVLNVGAGTGSYEPADRHVVAVEPSAEMIAQRLPGSAPVVQAEAESLPFDDDSFDAALAILTIHHWKDVAAGLAELRRVANDRVVLLTIDPAVLRELWMNRDYWPETIELESRRMPSMNQLEANLPAPSSMSLPVPWDCSDGFACAYWGRPEAILDPAVRQASSNWHAISAEATERGLQQLQKDLESGVWDRRYGSLRAQDSLDVGLRLMVAELA